MVDENDASRLIAVRVPREMYIRLKVYAAQRDVSIQELLGEAVVARIEDVLSSAATAGD